MLLMDVMTTIMKAKESAPTAEHFWAEAEQVILAYGQRQWNAGCAATARLLEQGGLASYTQQSSVGAAR